MLYSSIEHVPVFHDDMKHCCLRSIVDVIPIRNIIQVYIRQEDVLSNSEKSIVILRPMVQSFYVELTTDRITRYAETLNPGNRPSMILNLY